MGVGVDVVGVEVGAGVSSASHPPPGQNDGILPQNGHFDVVRTWRPNKSRTHHRLELRISCNYKTKSIISYLFACHCFSE